MIPSFGMAHKLFLGEWIIILITHYHPWFSSHIQPIEGKHKQKGNPKSMGSKNGNRATNQPGSPLKINISMDFAQRFSIRVIRRKHSWHGRKSTSPTTLMVSVLTIDGHGSNVEDDPFFLPRLSPTNGKTETRNIGYKISLKDTWRRVCVCVYMM